MMRTSSLKNDFLMDNRDNRLIDSLTVVGGVLLLFGAAVKITGWEYAPYIFMIGAVMFAAGQFADRYHGDDMIMKRLRRQQVTGAVFLIITAVLMILSSTLHLRLMYTETGLGDNLRSFLISLTKPNNWIVTMSIGAVLELYSALRMEHRQKTLDRK